MQYEKSFANSHEAILLRKILQDKKQCGLFLKYLMIEVLGGSTPNVSRPKNNIEFWVEVQRYKVYAAISLIILSNLHFQITVFNTMIVHFWSSQEMCHAHTTKAILQSKVKAILDCYIQSSSLPRLQIDIPLSLAEHVVRKSPGPYIFREAQVCNKMNKVLTKLSVLCSVFSCRL